MTLTVKLDNQERNRLDVLITALHCNNQSDVIRKLINDEFDRLQIEKTLVERRGGHPQHLLQGPANLSDRTTRKSFIAKKMKAKVSRRKANR